MEDKKKLLLVIGVIVVALVAIFVSASKSASGDKLQPVGSLEEGINHDTGMPLNPPPANAEQGDTTQQKDPSLGQ